MPINSVSEFTKAQLNGQTFPTLSGYTIPNAQAWIAPPVIGDMAEAPQIYVWSGKITEKRETMAGGRTSSIGTTAAFRILTYEMGIFIKYAMPNDEPLADNIFPVIVDTVMETLRGTTMPIAIVEVQTGWKSNITDFGEVFTVWYGDIHEAGDTRFWVYEAEIRMNIRESVQQ